MRRRVLLAALAFVLGGASPSAAVHYSWEGPGDGLFIEQKWFNVDTMMHHEGPPEAGDQADLCSACTITVNGGEVDTLGGFGGELHATGPFTATSFYPGGTTLTGPGLLTVGTLFTSTLEVSGGHLQATTVQGADLNVSAGGSTLVTGAVNGFASGGVDGFQSTLEVDGGATDFNFAVTNGGKAALKSTLTNGLDITVGVSGQGSQLDVTQTFSIAGGFIDVGAGAILNAHGDLKMTAEPGGPAGGANWTGTDTLINVGGDFIVGNVSNGGFGISLSDGAHLTTGFSFINGQANPQGSVQMTGAATTWEVLGSGGLAVGSSGSGVLGIRSGANLTLDKATPTTVFAVGLASGGNGRVDVEGQDSILDARGTLLSIGKEAGSTGAMFINDEGTLLLADDSIVGDGGVGTLTHTAGGRTIFAGTGNKTFTIGNLAGSNGTLVAHNPTVDVDLRQAQVKVGVQAASSGTMQIFDGAILDLAQDSYVAVGGGGLLSIGTGGEVRASGGLEKTLGVAKDATGLGKITIEGVGALLTTNEVFEVGVAGNGEVDVKPQGTLLTTLGQVGFATGSSGLVRVTGPEASWTSDSLILVGGNPKVGNTGFGTVIAETGGQIRATRSLFIRPGSLVQVNGGAIAVGTGGFGPPGTLSVAANGVLRGGTVQGSVIVARGATVSPGFSPGVLDITGDYMQQKGSVLEIEIGGTAPGTEFDQLHVSGTATLGGTLRVTLVNGFVPAGQSLSVIEAGAATGTFASVIGADVTYGATGITIVPNGQTQTTPPKTLAKCAATIAKLGGKFTQVRLKVLEACGGAALTCVETTAAGAARDACAAKATAACAKQMAQLGAAGHALSDGIGKACSVVVDDATIRGATGLGYDAVGAECAAQFGTTLDTLATVEQCVLQQHACGSEQIFDAEEPRARELMSAVGIAPSDVGAFSCLVDRGGAGADLGDPAGAGKALAKCVQGVKKAGAKFVATKLALLQKCVAASFVCATTNSDPTCVAKATKTCDGAFAAIDKAHDALDGAVGKACTTSVAALLDPAGANIAALTEECGDLDVPSVASLGDYQTCLFRQHECAVEDLLRFEAPRAGELLTAVSRSLDSPFCP